MTAATRKLVSIFKPKRTWLQFNLKGLMLLVVVVAVPFGWFKWKMDSKRKERAAIAEIIKLRGAVYYDWQTRPVNTPQGAAWLRKLLGNNFFARVVNVQLFSNTVTDDSLLNLEHLTDLEVLLVPCHRVSDEGLIHLIGLTKLKFLDLKGTALTDDGLSNLKRLTGLVHLDLSKTSVSGTGLIHLVGLTQLTFLDLKDTAMTNDGLDNLKQLTRLQYLDLSKTAVTDDGGADLQKALPNCNIIR